MFDQSQANIDSSCSPLNQGFFALTRDQMLYPNPTADQIHGDSSPHYYFIGRVLGKERFQFQVINLSFDYIGQGIFGN